MRSPASIENSAARLRSQHSQGSDDGQPRMPLNVHNNFLLTSAGLQRRPTVEQGHRQASNVNESVSSRYRPRQRMRRQLRDKRCGSTSRRSPALRRTVEPLPASLAARYSADALIFERVWTARVRKLLPARRASGLAMRTWPCGLAMKSPR